jgi:hypothetical protein
MTITILKQVDTDEAQRVMQKLHYHTDGEAPERRPSKVLGTDLFEADLYGIDAYTFSQVPSHAQPLQRVELVGSHARWKRPRLQTAQHDHLILRLETWWTHTGRSLPLNHPHAARSDSVQRHTQVVAAVSASDGSPGLCSADAVYFTQRLLLPLLHLRAVGLTAAKRPEKSQLLPSHVNAPAGRNKVRGWVVAVRGRERRASCYPAT